MMEYLNTVRDEQVVAREAIEPLIVMRGALRAGTSPKDCGPLFGHERSIFTAAWPVVRTSGSPRRETWSWCCR